MHAIYNKKKCYLFIHSLKKKGTFEINICMYEYPKKLCMYIRLNIYVLLVSELGLGQLTGCGEVERFSCELLLLLFCLPVPPTIPHQRELHPSSKYGRKSPVLSGQASILDN